MSDQSLPRKDGPQADPKTDRYSRRLQRILRTSDLRSPHLSGAVGSVEPRMTEQMKQSMLSPKLLNPTSAPEDDGPLFQCTQCDMIVRESDPYCPFCGAIFADSEAAEPTVSEPEPVKPAIERPLTREPVVRPDKFDIFSVFRPSRRSKELLYKEALRGFAGSARLLEEMERLVSEVSALGTDTVKARRLIGNAWEAARDGDWSLVTTLARETEEIVSPSIPDLVRTEIAKARVMLTQAKASGVDISPYVLQIKSAMHSLHADDPDEALRITKELMDHVREDSITWR